VAERPCTPLESVLLLISSFFEVVMNRSFASRIRISVLAISLPLAIATAPAVPFNASAAVAQGATSIDNIVAERIGDAFASLPKTSVERVGADAVILLPKGDRQRTSDCASATWPNKETSCLSTADGSPARPVRTITVGYRAGADTTLLLRLPGTDMPPR
jgi:hypothetical protein